MQKALTKCKISRDEEKCDCNVEVTRPLTGLGSPDGFARRKDWLAYAR